MGRLACRSFSEFGFEPCRVHYIEEETGAQILTEILQPKQHYLLDQFVDRIELLGQSRLEFGAMPEPIVTDPLVTEFIQRLKQRAEISEFSLTPWFKPGRTREWTAQLTGSVNALIHVVAATGTQGRWQVPQDIVSDFAGSGRKWAIVLLLRTSQTGYLVPRQEVRRRTESGEWSLHGGTYGVAEGPTLHSEYYFKEFDTLVFRLLTPGMI